MDEQLISGLEKLARLQLDPAERARLTHDLERILQMVDKLRELDTNGIAPLVHLNQPDDTARADTADPQLSPEEALRNAPKHDGRFFRVPKVIE